MANIRWTKGQQDRLRKAVDTFRKKVERYSKTDIAEALPEVPKIKELKKQITTSKELDRLVKDLRAFSSGANKGKPKIYVNPQGVKMTEWERQRVNKAIQQLNKQKEERVKKIESQEIYDAEGNKLPDIKRVAKKHEEIKVKKTPEKIKTSKEWRNFANEIQKQINKGYDEQRLITLQKNIISALKSYWGRDGAVYAEVVARMNVYQIKAAYEADPDTFSPEFIYTRDVYDSTKKSDEETAKDKFSRLIYKYVNIDTSRDIINDKLDKMNKKDKDTRELINLVNAIDDMTLSQDLELIYNILNKRVKASKKIEMLRALDLI